MGLPTARLELVEALQIVTEALEPALGPARIWTAARQAPYSDLKCSNLDGETGISFAEREWGYWEMHLSILHERPPGVGAAQSTASSSHFGLCALHMTFVGPRSHLRNPKEPPSSPFQDEDDGVLHSLHSDALARPSEESS